MERQVNISQSKEQNNDYFCKKYPKEMETCEFPGKEFKIVILKNLNELQVNTNN